MAYKRGIIYVFAILYTFSKASFVAIVYSKLSNEQTLEIFLVCLWWIACWRAAGKNFRESARYSISCTEWFCEVATMSRLLEIIGLFCRISSVLYGSFAKETYNFKEPTDRSHPIMVYFSRNYNEQWVWRWWRLLKQMNFLYTTEYRSDSWLSSVV